mgnify:CR=1 FL=1
MRTPVVTDIALAHRFSAPPGWISDEYAAARSHHGIVYAIEGAAFYGSSGCAQGTCCMRRLDRSTPRSARRKWAFCT